MHVAIQEHDIDIYACVLQACEQDIEKLCGLPLSRLDRVQGFDGKVVRCLQDFRDDLMVGCARHILLSLAFHVRMYVQMQAETCTTVTPQHHPEQQCIPPEQGTR